MRHAAADPPVRGNGDPLAHVHSVRTMPRRRSGATLLTHTTQDLARPSRRTGRLGNRGRT